MRVLVLALLVSSGCWGHHRATPGSSASWGPAPSWCCHPSWARPPCAL
ncbi:MAG: hypothetical protein HS111_29790 [Kofleriaceae bacterium]|nr:hypothetical protein [Kofleriaceae bacterium]